MLNIYIAHENGTYFANPIVYKCVYVDGGGGMAAAAGGGSGSTGAAMAPWLCKRTHLQKCKNRSTTDIDRTHCLGMNYYVNFLGGIDSNGFHIK